MKLQIGCSGWNYKDWKGEFYPEDVPKKDWLNYYSQNFNSVEVNGTFYNLPKDETIQSWHDSAPHNFGFTLKGSRYITHMKKLNGVADNVDKFYKAAGILGDKLDSILWQLPPNLHRDDDKLREFCETLDNRRNNVIEFRHQSWYDDEVYAILEANAVICCSISSPDFTDELIKTADKVYIRFHGKGKDWYDYHYSKKELENWTKKIRESGAKGAYIYFNNDVNAQAPGNALDLAGMLKGD
ncbi:Uncharacterized conserved protein YecE, DUF72 family [Psychroflexus sediminis]|uniref:Uncharacterized conserved protein YecE, DUF72 family n=2 Tax=Psychroflexus sediminis TaxID=470826 RepID=A0A1G7TXP4_9FLAO|nr:Uncharacterized conserved protein YecE, DUF72 family [Psychroflexus sediminis]